MSKASGKFTILVVDDDPVTRIAVAKQLSAHGYRTQTAADGMEALTVFQELGADVVILDIKMPDMDGFEVCEAIKKHADVPIIFITGAKEGIIRHHLEKIVDAVGAERYMRKPLDGKALIQLVGEVLEQAPH